jgi:ribosomal protein L32
MLPSLLRTRLSSVVLGPWALMQRAWRSPPSLVPLLAEAAPARTQPGMLAPLADLFDGFLWMAVPKKKLSYTRKRVRQAGQRANRGPFEKSHMTLCPVCERMRAPHRVCDREDCKTYFKHRWY